MLFLPALHPEAVYLHPYRTEKVLETFASVGRSDKGGLMKKKAEELLQPAATAPGKKGPSAPLDGTATSFGDLSK